jgi:hypothetical protein
MSTSQEITLTLPAPDPTDATGAGLAPRTTVWQLLVGEDDDMRAGHEPRLVTVHLDNGTPVVELHLVDGTVALSEHPSDAELTGLALLAAARYHTRRDASMILATPSNDAESPVWAGHPPVWLEDDPEPDLPEGYLLRDTDGDTWELTGDGWALQLEGGDYQGVPLAWEVLRRYAPLTGFRPGGQP